MIGFLLHDALPRYAHGTRIATSTPRRTNPLGREILGNGTIRIVDSGGMPVPSIANSR